MTKPDSADQRFLDQSTADRILAVGPYPPPITGQSVAFALAVDGLDLAHVDIGAQGKRADTAFSFGRAREFFGQLYAVWRAMAGKRTIYLTTASSLFGLIRDSLIILPARLTGLNAIAHIHQGCFDDFLRSLNPLLRAYARWLYRRLAVIIVLSETFLEQYAFVDKDRLAVVPNGVAGQPVVAIGPPKETVELLYLSNLMPQKGVLPLIEAVALLPERYRLTMAGGCIVCAGDPYRDADHFGETVRQRIDELGLDQRVKLAGVVSGERKDRLLSSAHVLCLPTYYENEAQPLCAIEALMAGVPVVSTDHRDLASIVDDDRGRKIASDAPEVIAQAIREVTVDEKTWLGLSERAKQVARERYSRRTHLTALAQVLEKATTRS